MSLFGKLVPRLASVIPAFAALSHSCCEAEEHVGVKIENSLTSSTLIVAGTAVPDLGRSVSDLLGLKTADVNVRRFSDGEIHCRYDESVREKNLYIVQSCAAPVNDNIMELMLLISAAKRAGANRVTAVIPYFGYKYHRRGLPISTVHQSRFLWSASGDFAEMLGAVGVDNIIAVDLQRPGQGHEACFFDNNTPIETISTEEIMVEYFASKVKFDNRIVVVAPNADCVKKAVKFKRKLSEVMDLEPDQIDHAVFLSAKGDTNLASKPAAAEFVGDVKNADVIIVDEILETGKTLSILCQRLKRDGAKRVFLCSSHGIFSSDSMELIDLSPVEKVVVTDSIPLPVKVSSKIHQVSISGVLSKVIKNDAKAHRQVLVLSGGDRNKEEEDDDDLDDNHEEEDRNLITK
jgi:ribose-phosphate pyrophosphokinase